MDTSLSAADGTVEPGVSAVSWAAIFAGTAAAVAATLILIALGSGLGLASASPWANAGTTAATLSTLAAIWLIIVQWIASGVGGYLTGRLRTRWVGTHTHEVFFRDTAHGFVTWAIASLVLAMIVSSAASAIVGASVHAGAKVASGPAQGATSSAQAGTTTLGGYDVDMLFRSAHPDTNASSIDAHAEATRILTKGLAAGDVPTDDRTYLATQIAARAGISQDEAQKRVDSVIEQVKAADSKAREAADVARKAAATAATLTALSMLIGAFIACAAAALGGRERDLHP
jgi:hypothetical protein